LIEYFFRPVRTIEPLRIVSGRSSAVRKKLCLLNTHRLFLTYQHLRKM